MTADPDPMPSHAASLAPPDEPPRSVDWIVLTTVLVATSISMVVHLPSVEISVQPMALDDVRTDLRSPTLTFAVGAWSGGAP
jgi:hypothetical protein